jgi:hypothetical protein
MYSDPAHTQAISQAALDVVAHKHETLREHFRWPGERLVGARSRPGPDDGPAVPGGWSPDRGPLAAATVVTGLAAARGEHPRGAQL